MNNIPARRLTALFCTQMTPKHGGRIAFFFLAFAASAAAQTTNVCLDCHAQMDAPLRVTTEEFANNIHAQKGLTCASCHGGDSSNSDKAMSRAAGFRGKIQRAAIPQLCGGCHGNPDYMRQFNPSLRTDQLAQYRASVHGKKLAAGDTHVAVCTDCHGVHEIRPARDPRSSVHPLKVAETCGRCHADRDYMKAYGIPTDQFAAYSKSVHHEAMVERGDLSAPTCTTCHGNHGAAPPGVATVDNVCSSCHVYQSQLFDASPHKTAFAAAGLPGCVTCHSNHGIARPGDQMVGSDAQAVCTNCHSAGDAGLRSAQTVHAELAGLEARIARSNEVLDRAAQSGMEVQQAKLELAQASDALTKARVAVHAFRPDEVIEEAKSGNAAATRTYAAGVRALYERNRRRLGLGLSLLAIAATLVGLRLCIREIER